jgi:two-component system nitrate/nitrite response regulator NarL
MEGLRSLLESAEGLQFVAAETSLADGMDAARDLSPSILMVDKAFGLSAVMDCPGVLRQAGCQTAVVLWGAAFPEAEAVRFLQSGAAAVLRKTARLDVLLSCLRQVARGATWVEETFEPQKEPPLRPAHSPLTVRELQVMELVERGLKNKDIGDVLGIRTGTVKIHLKHIFEKTGIRGRYGLALSGLKEKGLLAPAVM